MKKPCNIPQNEYYIKNYSYYLSLRGENQELAKDMIEKCLSLYQNS